MPLTSPELVKKHLAAFRLGQATVADHPVVLRGTAAHQLPHGGLTSGSIVVKALTANDPTNATVNLAVGGVGLAHTHVEHGTVVLAADKSLGTIYTENVDYTVDAPAGKLYRIAAGSITEGQSVSVWYFHATIYAENTDYRVELDEGRLTRVGGGAIADGQLVRVDYEAAASDVTDASIELAIDEASQEIVRRIESTWYDTPDSGLITAETHWAVAVVARILAGAALSAPGADAASRKAAAAGWFELADRYAASALDHLKTYSAAPSERHAPAIARRS